MRETRITLPELGLLAGTRGVLGLGLGLLLANRLSEDQRRAAGWALFAVGALTTIPLAFEILGGKRVTSIAEQMGESVRDRSCPELEGRMGRELEPARSF